MKLVKVEGQTENRVETPLVTAAEIGGQKWGLWELTGPGMARLLQACSASVQASSPSGQVKQQQLRLAIVTGTGKNTYVRLERYSHTNLDRAWLPLLIDRFCRFMILSIFLPAQLQLNLCSPCAATSQGSSSFAHPDSQTPFKCCSGSSPSPHLHLALHSVPILDPRSNAALIISCSSGDYIYSCLPTAYPPFPISPRPLIIVSIY
jgi:hypothetical protein